MNAPNLTNYLGDSLKNLEFDRYLLSIGIKERPMGEDSTVFISSGDRTLDLTFSEISIYSEQNLIKPKSNGKFILEALTFYTGYKYNLPLELNFSLTEKEVENILGNPRQSTRLSDGKISNIYLKDNLLITVRFKRCDHGIEFVSIKVPDIFNQINGLT